MCETSFNVRVPLLALVFLLLSVSHLQAQVDTGTILGTVTDVSGATIGGAEVTLTNEDTNAAATTRTASDGSYKFTPVRIGRYRLLASFQGFQTLLRRGVIVNVGAAVVIDFILKPGSMKETVEVKSNTPLLQTQDASVGQVIDARSLNNLPL